MRYCYQMTDNGQIARVLDEPHFPRYLHEIILEAKDIAKASGEEMPTEEVDIRFLDHSGERIIMYYDNLLNDMAHGDGWGRWFSGKPGKLAFYHKDTEEMFMCCEVVRSELEKMLVWQVEFLHGASYGELVYIQLSLLKLNALVLDEDIYVNLVR